MRELFLELVDHFNKHQFKDNPVVVEDAVKSKERIVALFEECGKWADMTYENVRVSDAIEEWLQHMGFVTAP